MIKFWYNLAPNPMKVALFLEELGVAYDPIPVDTRKGEQHTEGKILRRGDFQYAPPNTEHGPFEYPVGGIVFAVFRFPPVAAK